MYPSFKTSQRLISPALDLIGVKPIRPYPVFILAQDVFRNENFIRQRLFVKHRDRSSCLQTTVRKNKRLFVLTMRLWAKSKQTRKAKREFESEPEIELTPLQKEQSLRRPLVSNYFGDSRLNFQSKKMTTCFSFTDLKSKSSYWHLMIVLPSEKNDWHFRRWKSKLRFFPLNVWPPFYWHNALKWNLWVFGPPAISFGAKRSSRNFLFCWELIGASIGS